MLDRLRNAFDLLRRRGDIEAAIKEVQRALILSDVSVKHVKELTERVRVRLSEERKKYPGIAVSDLAMRILYEEVSELLGGKGRPFPVVPQRIVLVGLYGSGKTTTAAKLALWFKKRGLRPLLVALDTHRPAAYEQLKQLAERAGVEFFGSREERDPSRIAADALEIKADVYIFDTAGRSALDEELLEEVKKIKEVVLPEKTLLVLPADIGQVAEREARRFAEEVGIDGIVVTKVDGSGRAGGALSACKEAGVPVYFVGTGEGLEDLEEFDAQRLVGRIIGVPDVRALLERTTVREDIGELLGEKYTINTFYKQLKMLAEIGPLDKVFQMLGITAVPEDVLERAAKKFKKYDAIYKSMTKQEREHPEIINESRMRRIARGSGTTLEDVRSFMRDFWRAKKMFETVRKRRDVRRLLRGLGV